MNSALFKNLGLTSGLDGSGGQPDPTNPFTQASPYALKPSTQPQMSEDEAFLDKLNQEKARQQSLRTLKINDLRKINPANGLPFKNPGSMSASVNPEVVKAIIRQAVNKGTDPNTALAIALQETKMGNMNEQVGSAWSTLPDEGIADPYEAGANSMVKSLVDKLAYAKRLGFDKKGEAYALQAYNGYGILGPGANGTASYYGIPVTKKNPLNMRENPVYGKTILSVRDQIIKQHPELQKLIQAEMASRKKPTQTPPNAYARK